MQGEKWFGADVGTELKKLADQGLTKAEVADEHGIDRAQMTRICRQFPNIKWIDGRHNRAKSYRTIRYNGIEDTISGHAKRCGVNKYTAFSRLERGKGLDRVFG